MRTTRTIFLCAFILWGHGWLDGRNVQRPSYEPVGTYTSLAECEGSRKDWPLPPRYTRAVCLPDTVNPNTR